MRRTIPVVAVLVLVAMMLGVPGVATAAKPYHERILATGEWFFPEGAECDFNYGGTYEVSLNYFAWGDPVTREMISGPYTAVHMNLDTGSSLVDTGSYVDIYEYEAQTWVEIGLTWHLRDPSTGKLVEVTAGWVTFDWETGEALESTPNQSGDAAALICPLLGGNPA